MTEENLFKPIAHKDIYGDAIGHVTLYDSSHANESEEQRIWCVTTTASLAYGNEEAKNPEALYERMKSIKHESLWEFIRVGGYLSNLQDSMRNYINFGTDAAYAFTCKEELHIHTSNIACFRIKVPIFVARQFMRHRSFSYLEMSRRYTKDAKVPFEFWMPTGLTEETKAIYTDKALRDYSIMTTEYGLHTQVASRFLPQITYTEFYMMGEVEGLKNFFTLRCAKEAQEEIREVAMSMLQLIAEHQPELYEKVLP